MATEHERELIRIIKDSADPERALVGMMDILTRYIAGESPKSIMASYGIDWEE